MDRNAKYVVFCTFIVLCAIIIPAVSAMSTSDILLPFHQNWKLSETNLEYQISNQEKAPLYIEFEVTPEMVTEVKYIMPKYSSTEGYEKTVTYPSENSWFQITIINSNTREVLAQNGYGRAFPQSNTTTKFPVLRNGPYTVLIDGNACTVDLSIKGSETGKVYSSTASPTASTIIAGDTPTTKDLSDPVSSQTTPVKNQGNLLPVFSKNDFAVIGSVFIALMIFGVVEIYRTQFFKIRKRK